MTKETHKESIALLLGGGGAKAAYQVGVLKGIASFYPSHHKIPFDIICGTSAGAINATSLACFASNFELSIRKLEWIWHQIRTEQIYHCSGWRVTSHLLAMFFRNFRVEHANNGAASLLNSAPLRKLLRETIDFNLIDRQIARKSLTALSITCSCYQTKSSVTFFQGKKIPNWKRARHSGQKCHISLEHLMASAAIPLIFPAISIKNLYFGDGTLHQQTPLSAPIHLGAEKILTISLDHSKKSPNTFKSSPSSAALTAHLLETIFSDTLNSDLERFERINHTLTTIPEQAREKVSLRPMEILVLRPSCDLNEMTKQYFHYMPKAVRILLNGMGANTETATGLVSYLLFEANYCQDLIKLGERDALNQAEEIKRFLNIS
jgi:NTE family protein